MTHIETFKQDLASIVCDHRNDRDDDGLNRALASYYCGLDAAIRDEFEHYMAEVLLQGPVHEDTHPYMILQLIENFRLVGFARVMGAAFDRFKGGLKRKRFWFGRGKPDEMEDLAYAWQILFVMLRLGLPESIGYLRDYLAGKKANYKRSCLVGTAIHVDHHEFLQLAREYILANIRNGKSESVLDVIAPIGFYILMNKPELMFELLRDMKTKIKNFDGVIDALAGKITNERWLYAGTFDVDQYVRRLKELA